MGDSGALFSGFLLATLSVTGVMQVESVAMWVPLLVLAVPIFDITFASFRRIMKGKSPFVADAEHIHHRLLHAGLSQNQTVLVLTIIAAIVGAIGVLCINVSIIKYFIYAMALAVVMLILNFQARK